MWYLFILILLFLLTYHYDYRKNSKGRFWWILTILFLYIITAGLRYRLGTDTITYEREYIYLPSISDLTSFDYSMSRYGYGYLFFNSISRSISDSFVVMQFIHAICINCILFYFFYKHTSNFFLSVSLYFIMFYFNFNFEVLRESCAVCIFLLSLKYYIKDRWLKYYLICGIACLFHMSAIFTFFLPMIKLPILNKLFQFNKYFIISSVIVLSLSYYLSIKFFDIIRLFTLIDTGYYVESYSDSRLSESVRLPLSTLLFHISCYCIFPLLSLWVQSRSVNNEQKNNTLAYINIFSLMTCLYVYIAISSLYLPLLHRFNNYLLPVVVVLMSKSAFVLFKKSNHCVKLSFSVWCLIIFPFYFLTIYPYLNKDNLGIVKIRRYYPYESVLNPTIDVERERIFTYYNK